ncbi:MAG: peptidylprolyl isomerase, partial [bacterium]
MSRKEDLKAVHSSKSAIRRLSRMSNPAVENMESRELLAAPAMQPLANLNVPGNKSLIVPLSSTTSDMTSVSYSTSASNENVKTTILSGGTFVRMNISGYGDLTFKLFDDLAPETVNKIKSLVSSGFYDGLTFHRIIKNFMIQGGDPKGNGTGGPGYSFDDEFNANAIFSGSGQLAMANSGKDTNGSQFFVTTGPQRTLDFNYTIFGQLVSGFDVLNKIQNVTTNKTDVPTTPVIIGKASVIQDNTDAVMIVQVPQGTPASELTITATASDGESSQQKVVVTNYADPVNDPPFLGKIAAISTPLNQPVTFNVPATDLENDNLEVSVAPMNNADKVTVSINGAAVTITPKDGFSGDVNLAVGVRQSANTTTGAAASGWDTQVV